MKVLLALLICILPNQSFTIHINKSERAEEGVLRGFKLEGTSGNKRYRFHCFSDSKSEWPTCRNLPAGKDFSVHFDDDHEVILIPLPDKHSLVFMIDSEEEVRQ